MIDLNGYIGKYKNYKSVSENIAQGGEYWVKTYAMDDDSVAFNGIVQFLPLLFDFDI